MNKLLWLVVIVLAVMVLSMKSHYDKLYNNIVWKEVPAVYTVEQKCDPSVNLCVTVGELRK